MFIRAYVHVYSVCLVLYTHISHIVGLSIKTFFDWRVGTGMRLIAAARLVWVSLGASNSLFLWHIIGKRNLSCN